MAPKKDSSTVKLRPADSFDLIRLIARSQSDPRKAVAELVQNSLDAGAVKVRVTWFTHQKQRAVSVYDNGAGIFPDLDRPAALKRVATTIGHSHKARLTPAERHRQMTLGKYGIGLLGFWSVGKRMEIRSRVGGSEVWMLEMEEDVREARVRKRRSSRLPLESTLTEVVITGIHPVAAQQIKPRRLAAYLAGELRGQLLERDAVIEIHDRVGRGRTQKRRVVKPLQYRGMHLSAIRELEVSGYVSARTDLYLVPEGDNRTGRVSLACGGATVLDDIALIDGPLQPRAPWSSGRFEGVVDFPDLTVAPSSRRGVVPDDAARAFLNALPALEALLVSAIEEDAERILREREADDARRIRRLYRKLPRSLPSYAFFEISGGDEPGADARGAAGAALSEAEGESLESSPADTDSEEPAESPETEFIYPPGPLHSVEIRPKKSILAPGGARWMKAVPLDADGRPVSDEIAFEWLLEGPGVLSARGHRAL